MPSVTRCRVEERALGADMLGTLAASISVNAWARHVRDAVVSRHSATPNLVKVVPARP